MEVARAVGISLKPSFSISFKASTASASISGITMGNISYNIKYISDESLLVKNEIDSILYNFNNIFRLMRKFLKKDLK